jgi:Flp pilus assembly protein TadG
MFTLRQVGTTLCRKAAQFRSNRDGNVAMMFSIALLPLLAAGGSALDYGRASNARAELQNAVDSTVLAMAKRSPLLNDTQLRTEAAAHFRAVLNQRQDLAMLPITVVRTDKRLSITATGDLPMSFMKVFGVDRLTVGSLSEASIEQRKVELALVLDNTGSMSRLSKMDELKKATKNLINAAEASAPAGSGMIKMALIPFDTKVKLNANDYRFQSWLAFRENAAPRTFDDIRASMATKAGWQGCLVDRGVGFDANDRRVDVSRPESYHPAVDCGDSAGLARMQPLTDNWNALRAISDSMRPSGCTNITIGARYGLAALSPSEPIGGGVPFGTANVDKYMVILTDGNNTKNRYATHADCGGRDPLNLIDDKTKALCDDIKSKSSAVDALGRPIPDVKIFTVRVMEGSRALLSNCATNATMYKEVNNASDIDAVFKDILREITRLRLTV